MRERKSFDKAFKEQASMRVISGETTSSRLDEELGVHYTTIKDWVKTYKLDGENAFPGKGHLTPMDEENRRLRKELANLKEENEILKKPRHTLRKIRSNKVHVYS